MKLYVVHSVCSLIQRLVGIGSDSAMELMEKIWYF